MTDFTMRTLAAAAAMLLAGPLAQAQEVQVLSGGKPFAISDEINASFAPARDERKAKHHLSERSDAMAIAEAYTGAFLHCGMNEALYPPNKPAAPEELNYFAKDASFIPIAGTRKAILLGEYGRGKAIVDLDKHTVMTPQCPAGVRTAFWSYSTDRVVFATQAVMSISFHGASRALWTAKFNDAQDLYYFDSTHATKGFHKLLSLPDERVVDVLLPDNTDHMWVLSQVERTDLGNPSKWIKAAAGSRATKMDFTLRKVDLHGAVLDTVEVARSVPDGAAHFVRE